MKTGKRRKKSEPIIPSNLLERKSVLATIEEDPKAFFKMLKKFFRQELIFTVTFSLWEKKKMGWRKRHLLKLKRYPAEIAAVANIMKALDKNFPLTNEKDHTYGNKTLVETAVIIYDMYNRKIWHYMKKNLKKKESPEEFKYTPEEALAEQIARGFMLKEDVDLNTKLPYIHSNVDKKYIWPEQWDMATTYEKFELIGVSGYTGIKPPRSYRN